MNEAAINYALIILLIGVSIILVMLIRSGLRRIGIPSIVGFILLGFLIRITCEQFGILSKTSTEIFELFAKLGIIILLFRIGLESNISGMIHQLRNAGLLGFSVAIGAFFAGLVFSRDPKSVKIDTSFETLFEFFSPFFFIGIGLNIAPNSVTASIGIGVILLMAAVVGKLIGHGAPAAITGGWISFALIGFSMVPRAEIAMIILQHGQELGQWAVPPEVFTAMVFVTALTCIFSPLIIRSFLEKWPQNEGAE